MKVLFITKPFVIEPLGLMYLSASAKKAEHQVDLALTTEDLEAKISEFKPQVVGYSVMTGDQNFYLDLNRRLKQKHSFLSAFGGPHPTFFPSIIKEEGVDVICRGEGEQAFVELLDTLESGGEISHIKNLWINKNGEITQNPVRGLVDIDSLPFPDRDLVSRIPEIRDGPIKHFLASRGCPFSCSYCFNESYSEIYQGKGKRVRFRDISSLTEEVSQVVSSTPTRFVYFQDDTFTLDKKWLDEFAKQYSSKVGLPFHCHVRPNTLDKHIIDALKKAGCYSVHIAAETADDRLRNEILNRKMTKEQIVQASNLLRQEGIKFMLQNMIGLPTGSIENDLETLEMNIKCKPDYSWVSIFQPYPGTRLGKLCEEKGFYSGDFSDLKPSFFVSSPLNFSDEYKNQLTNLQKLFAIFVEFPELHNLGLSEAMISIKSTPEISEAYSKAYTEFRKKADERLYGFKL